MVINFLFDYRTPLGALGFGYERNHIPEIFEYATNSKEDSEGIVYLQRRNSDNKIVRDGTMLIGELLEDGVNCHITYVQQFEHLKQKDSSTFLVPFESVNHKTFFSDFYKEDFDLDNCLSKKLIELLKSKDNVKLLFSDSREGSYPIDETPFLKIQKWLDKHEISHKQKVIVCCLNNKIKELLPNDSRLVFVNPEFYISLAGKFIKEVESETRMIVDDRKRDGYHYDVKRNFHCSPKKHFLFYNRNSSRIHRPYTITQLIKKDLFNKGLISLHKSQEFDGQVSSKKYEFNNKFTEEEQSLFEKIQKEYPYVIDESDENKVSSLHNFLSNAEDYNNTLFSIVGETSACSQYMFITEKTMKPIMNFHPFFVVGNPFTLKRLKELGFKTFSDVWDESYDNELDMKIRVGMIVEEVKKLCDMELSQLQEYLQKIKNICIYNREHLVKLYEDNFKYKQLISVLKKDLV